MFAIANIHMKLGVLLCTLETIVLCFRLATKEAAAQAIVGLNGTEIAGFQCRCAWGKESNDVQRQQQQASYQQGYGYGNQVSLSILVSVFYI